MYIILIFMFLCGTILMAEGGMPYGLQPPYRAVMGGGVYNVVLPHPIANMPPNPGLPHHYSGAPHHSMALAPVAYGPGTIVNPQTGQVFVPVAVLPAPNLSIRGHAPNPVAVMRLPAQHPVQVHELPTAESQWEYLKVYVMMVDPRELIRAAMNVGLRIGIRNDELPIIEIIRERGEAFAKDKNNDPTARVETFLELIGFVRFMVSAPYYGGSEKRKMQFSIIDYYIKLKNLYGALAAKHRGQGASIIEDHNIAAFKTMKTAFDVAVEYGLAACMGECYLHLVKSYTYLSLTRSFFEDVLNSRLSQLQKGCFYRYPVSFDEVLREQDRARIRELLLNN